jgi:hypothetical protein
MIVHNDLKEINTPMLLYMINLFDPDALRIMSPTEKINGEKTLRFLKHELDSRKEDDSTIGKPGITI